MAGDAHKAEFAAAILTGLNLYESFETTIPSVPILTSLGATRRDHATGGARMWGEVLDLAAKARRALAAIPGVVVFGREDLAGAGAHDLDGRMYDTSWRSVMEERSSSIRQTNRSGAF